MEWIWHMHTSSSEQGMHLNAKGVQFHNVCNNLNKITGVCCGIRNASAKMMTKSFVKQKLQYCERIDELQDQLLPIPWHCGRRDEQWRPQPQQPIFHNCRSGQWQVMYYDSSHFTFWNEFWIQKKISNRTKHYGLHIKGYWKRINNLMKELGKRKLFDLIESKQITHTFY